MAKKIEESEVKKECPSCGLGVALDSRICEFCGWDFQEEDEWILQIEKLERELLTEKQKFEPGSVDQRIEATLHVPVARRTSSTAKGDQTASAEEHQPPGVEPQASPQANETDAGAAPEREPPPKKAPVVRHVKSAPEPEPEPVAEASGQAKTRKVRVVRKVKQ